jgi:rhodanese-related sulfurtransferase
MTAPMIDPREAFALLAQGAVLVDVRAREEFEDGHPLAAVNVPLAGFVEGRLVDREDFVDRVHEACAAGVPLLLLCRSGVRAERAAAQILARSPRDVRVVRGGYEGTRGPFGEVLEPGWRRLALP